VKQQDPTSETIAAMLMDEARARREGELTGMDLVIEALTARGFSYVASIVADLRRQHADEPIDDGSLDV